MAIMAMPGFSTKVQADTLPVAILISREIKPFIEMVEGLESALDQPVVRIFIDKNNSPFSHDPLYKGTQIDNYSFVVAVGPSALSYLVENNKLTQDTIPQNETSPPQNEDNRPQPGEALPPQHKENIFHTVVVPTKQINNDTRINNSMLQAADTRLNIKIIPHANTRKILYAMVLNPETIIPRGVSLCGISLNLFSEETIAKIKKVFPSVKKMGILFDPDNNSEWFQNAKNQGLFNEINSVPIYIKEQHDVNRLHQNENSDVDALLFIPDKTVTSPTIISHIIKQSIARRIPVIGYNSFFHKSGAALSFILDYRIIGMQMAQKIMTLSRDDLCESSTPAYHMTLNRSVVDLINLELGTSLPPELKVVP
ncbi:MAG: hypothetical protein HQK62_03455 [Desulfamplus sp.]|nr:hypothetical protein [Desulfamplus sp.]MBF0257889.1 hypothetical protein [Desulfamplus sp.]